MLWPIILPFKITFCCIAVLIGLATLASPLVRSKHHHMFFYAMLMGMIAFVPSCTGIMNVLDAKRFGLFEFASFDEVNDFRVERYLPPTARGITINKYAQGFRARFKITESELSSFLDELWTKYGDRSIIKRGEMSSLSVVDPESHELYFGDLNWPHLENATEHYSPTAGNGVGFSVWFSPSEGIAYQRAGYW